MTNDERLAEMVAYYNGHTEGEFADIPYFIYEDVMWLIGRVRHLQEQSDGWRDLKFRQDAKIAELEAAISPKFNQSHRMTVTTCLDCRFCVKQDDGYSNWTVLDTTLSCLKNLNPAFPQENTYEWKIKADEGIVVPELRAAESCPGFAAGEGPWFDVDGETTAEDYKDDAEVYALLKATEPGV